MALLVACGGAQPAAPEVEEPVEAAEEPAEETPEPTEEETAEPAEEQTAEPTEEPEPTPVVGETPQDTIVGNLMPVAGDPEIVAATIFLMLTEPYDDGEAIIFHFEDAMSGVSVGCSGYTLAVERTDGWELAELDIRCGRPTGPDTPVSAFLSEVPSGTTVFGEIYDAAVAEVVVVVDGEEISPALGGGAYLARLPGAAAEDIVVQALDADGDVIYEGTPRSSGEGQ